MPATLQELTDYYKSLLAYEYRGLPNATRQMALYSKQFVADNLAAQVDAAFDLETAVGAQLDIIGKYVGVSRNIGVGAVQSFFGFWSYGSSFLQSGYQGTWNPTTNSPALPSPTGLAGDWYAIQVGGVAIVPPSVAFSPGDIVWSDGTAWLKATTDNANGLTTYSDYSVNANAQMYSYSTATRNVTALSDSDYRSVIRFQIIRNSSDGTLAGIMAAINAVFPNQIWLVDNADMTMDYSVSTAFPLSAALLAQFLPRPMGVGITVTLVAPPGSGGRILTEDDESLITEFGEFLTT